MTMASVNTVTGPVETADLGVTLMHEHLSIGLPGWRQVWPDGWDRAADLERCVRLLVEARDHGVRAIVDPCPIDLERQAEFLAEASARSGVRIICATGLYNQRLGLPSYWRTRNADQMAAEFIRELTDGIADTGIRPGIIKAATSEGRIRFHEEKALRAAARASLATDTPIITHTENGTCGPEQVDLFLEEGVAPHRVIIGHSCGNADLRYHTSMLQRGVWLGMDRIGLRHLFSDDLRHATLVGLIGAGWAGQLFLSQDHVACVLGRGVVLGGASQVWREEYGYVYLFKEFIPRLAAAGVGEDVIRRMLVDNPRRYFEGRADQ
jgi:phosphotriesterase-related protein